MGFLDLIDQCALSSMGEIWGNLKALGPNNVNTVINRIPVSSLFGFLTTDSVVSARGYLDVSGQTSTTLRFELTDGRNKSIIEEVLELVLV